MLTYINLGSTVSGLDSNENRQEKKLFRFKYDSDRLGIGFKTKIISKLHYSFSIGKCKLFGLNTISTVSGSVLKNQIISKLHYSLSIGKCKQYESKIMVRPSRIVILR
jgi:hypothetical protein